MNKKLKNNGITLISLVITIIVMLILVGVSITLAVNGGLFEYAGNAVGDTKNAMKNEQGLIDEIINDYIKPNVPEIPEGLKVGDYVNYTPTTGTYKVVDGENGSGFTTNEGYQEFTTDTTLKWRVWSIDEKTGQIELISDKATHELYLNGADGYNHGVDILNDLCKTLYSNENGATARSINVEDINEKTTYDYKEYVRVKDDFSIKYGKTIYISEFDEDKREYPSLYSQEIGFGTKNKDSKTGLSGSKGLQNGSIADGGITVYSSKGYIEAETDEDAFVTFDFYGYETDKYLKKSVPKGLIGVNEKIWIASRCVRLDSISRGQYCIRNLNTENYLGASELFPGWNYSETSKHIICCGLRPIVLLGTNETLEKSETQPSEDFTYWDIKI